jgi:hypothetical protein
MKESAFTDKFIPCMRERWPYMWSMKIHGHEMQQSAIPDFLFCINSVFVAIEFKVQRDGRISTTPLQMRELHKIQNAKGIGLLVAYDENIDKILVRNKRIDYMAIKTKYIKIDWDFEFNNYETTIDLIEVMVSNV